jgi:hypothetical protein
MNAPLKKIPASEAGIQVTTKEECGMSATVNNNANLAPGEYNFAEYSKAAKEYMEKDLAKSGLIPEDLGAFVPPRSSAFFTVASAYRIPYFDRVTLREIDVLYSDKLLAPRINPATGKTQKYDKPSKQQTGIHSNYPYFNPKRVQNINGVLYIDEGEKKCAAAIKHGQHSVGLSGCWNWRGAAGGLHEEIYAEILEHGIKEVCLRPDGDFYTNIDVRRAWSELYHVLKLADLTVRVRDLRKTGKIDDFLGVPGATIEAFEQLAGYVEPSEITINAKHLAKLVPGLDIDKIMHGESTIEVVKSTSDNLTKVMQKFYGADLFYNTDYQEFMFRNEKWKDHYTVQHVTNEFQSMLGFNRTGTRGNAVATGKIEPVMKYVCRRNERSPICDYLLALKWDGTPRLETWLHDYLHVADTEFYREAGKRFLIAAVARKLKPGCFLRFRLILKGGQSKGKTGIWESLFGRENCVIKSEWASQGKDEAIALISGWCVIDDELGKSFAQKDITHQKSVISANYVDVRLPHDRMNSKILLGCVQVATTNSGAFIAHDATGNNRHVVIETGDDNNKFDFAGVEAARDQLFAEAVHLYQQGEPFNEVIGADAAALQYTVLSPLYEPIREVLAADVGTHTFLLAASDKWVVKRASMEEVMFEKRLKFIPKDIGAALEMLGFQYSNNGVQVGGKRIRSVYVIPQKVFQHFVVEGNVEQPPQALPGGSDANDAASLTDGVAS